MLSMLPNLILVSGVAAGLALVIQIAKRFLADYGECAITLNEEKKVVVLGGSSLLSSLMDKSVFLPSACGGRGTCSLCKVRVTQGGGPLLPTETPYLSVEEKEQKVRLACQVKVRNDLAIMVPEELFNIKEFRVSVRSIKQMTPQIKAIFLEIISPEEGIVFKPGQYVQLQMPTAKGEPEYRAYSICSSTANPQDVELLITKVPEGVISSFVHGELKEGDELTIVGPFGDFYYVDSDREVILIATGSGLAPIRSILQHLEERRVTRPILLFFGARTEADLLYHHELSQTAVRMPNLTYLPTLSRPDQGDDWQGDVGRVTSLIEKYVPQEAMCDVYICGSPPMVEACEKALEAKGVKKEFIYYDKFT